MHGNIDTCRLIFLTSRRFSFLFQENLEKDDFRIVAQRSRVIRELGVGLPLALWFNIPIIGNSFLVVAILFPQILPVSWRSFRQRVENFANMDKRRRFAFVEQLRGNSIFFVVVADVCC